MSFFHPKPKPTQVVTNGRFEIERDGQVAYLEYSLAGNVLELIHTEVPAALRGKGTATVLVESAVKFARQHHLKIDVICPIVANYMKKHPEYADMLLR